MPDWLKSRESRERPAAGSVERVRSQIEWWVRVVPALVVLDVVLFVALQTHPGAIGPLLWDVGAPCLAGIGCGLLVAALVSSLRKRTVWNRWRAAGCLGVAAVMVSIPVFYGRYPSSHDSAPSRVDFLLPLEGPITVAWGGPTRELNYHSVLPDQRWAYDLLVTEQGRSFRGDGAQVQDYYCYNLPVLAPAAGRVQEAHDGEPDTPIGSRGPLVGVGSLGNHVVIEVAPNEFLIVAHLGRGSLTVARGDWVTESQEIGRVGNSGHSSEPHVHLHLQDRAASLLAEGVPFYFVNYRHAGRLVDRGMPEGGVRRRRFVGQVIEQVRREDARGSPGGLF